MFEFGWIISPTVLYLRFIAERGDGGQLTYIDKVDEAYNLKPMPNVGLTMNKKSVFTPAPEKPISIVAKAPR